MKNILPFIFLLFAGGCALLPKEKIIASINDYNLAVEKAQNEMLLLNVVRASLHRPMYFTGFNLLRGNMTYNISTGLTIPFGKIGKGIDTSYSLAPSISYSTNPSFDVGVLDTKEFIRGIMTPVSMETMDYYWQAGWPKEMLLLLFVERVEINDGKDILNNYPSDDDSFKKFQDWVSKTTTCKINSKEKPAIGPDIRIGSDIDVSKLLEIVKSGYMITPATDRQNNTDLFQLKSQKKDYYIDCEDTKKIYTSDSQHENNNEQNGDRIYLRSPDAMLYYLGEVISAKFNKKFDTMIYACSSDEVRKSKLFEVYKSEKVGGNPYVSVDYEGSTYVIPSNTAESDDVCPAARSMLTLTLISQLISLQKSGENLPTTGVVNVLGR